MISSSSGSGKLSCLLSDYSQSCDRLAWTPRPFWLREEGSEEQTCPVVSWAPECSHRYWWRKQHPTSVQVLLMTGSEYMVECWNFENCSTWPIALKIWKDCLQDLKILAFKQDTSEQGYSPDPSSRGHKALESRPVTGKNYPTSFWSPIVLNTERPGKWGLTYFASDGESAGTRSGTSPCLGIGMWPLWAVPESLEMIPMHEGWTLSVHRHRLILSIAWDCCRARQQRCHWGRAILWGLQRSVRWEDVGEEKIR